MDVSTAIGAAVSALGFAKTAASTAVAGAVEGKVREKVNEALDQVGKAQEALLTIQASLFSLQSENFALKEQVRSLADAAARREQYELVDTPGGAQLLRSTTVPLHYICPACHASKAEYQILQPYGNRSYVMCPSKSCDQRYRIDDDSSDAARFRSARYQGDF